MKKPVRTDGMKKPERQIHIREAGPGDAKVIAHLAATTFSDTFKHEFRDLQDLHDYLDRTFSEEKIAGSLAKDNNIFWLAFVDDQPAGYAKLKIHSPCPHGRSAYSGEDAAQLQKIYVLQEFLALKVGLTLQNILLEKAKALGRNKVWLSVQDRNRRAITFYERTGFEKIADHSFSIGKEDFDFFAMGITLT